MAEAPTSRPTAVDATTIRGKVMCGYQGWFRCPGDDAKLGWVHWSHDSRKLEPKALTFEMWPDVSEFPAAERFIAPGFTHPDGSQAYLFSTDNADTVLRHFQWMRDYGIDGAFLQHFAVDLPGGPAQSRYPSRLRVLHYVQQAAAKTGRAWAITYDISGMPVDRIFDAVTTDWKKLVEEGITSDPRYLHEGGKPVVQLFGFYWRNRSNAMTPELGNRLVDFFKADGKYAAFFFGGGDWDWRRNPDPQWQALFHRFDAYAPWNVGNYSTTNGVKRAATGYWAEDKAECRRHNSLWIPVIYPGFSWDNLQRKPPGTSLIARRRGEFLWEQFCALAKMHETGAYVAMFDEVDEGTAIFKLSPAPPTQAHFVDTEGMPADWYLRLVGEGTRMLRGERDASETIPIKP